MAVLGNIRNIGISISDMGKSKNIVNEVSKMKTNPKVMGRIVKSLTNGYWNCQEQRRTRKGKRGRG